MRAHLYNRSANVCAPCCEYYFAWDSSLDFSMNCHCREEVVLIGSNLLSIDLVRNLIGPNLLAIQSGEEALVAELRIRVS